MAKFFSEQEIDEFRDCFYLNSKSGTINDVEQLKFVMRSVGFCPTVSELNKYMEDKKHKMNFADFLDCAHAHTQVEKIPDEILKALESSPFVRDKNIPIDTLRHILCNWGEKLSHQEFNAIQRELNLNKPEIPYRQFVKSLTIPKSDNN